MIKSRAVCFFAVFFSAFSILSVSGAGYAAGKAEIWFDVSKGEHLLRVMSGSDVVDSFGIAVGKNTGQKERAGDMRTPEGIFTVEQVQDASWWSHDFGDGKGPVAGAYGPWFIRLKTGWRGIGIHGTHDPASIGTDATEGCIRLRNEDVDRLKEKYVKIGMRVVIRP
ncbi:MAG TPA: L,D-transpeptidase [Candidatus Caccocola faecipullorum]|nr:L,D-transpeptidase [Candidatus Caccocola faecipullorum]